MMVSIYISVWLRTWTQDEGSDNILRARKNGLVRGGLSRCQKWEVGMLLGERF